MEAHHINLNSKNTRTPYHSKGKKEDILVPTKLGDTTSEDSSCSKLYHVTKG